MFFFFSGAFFRSEIAVYILFLAVCELVPAVAFGFHFGGSAA
jgi:hypothetical protein